MKKDRASQAVVEAETSTTDLDQVIPLMSTSAIERTAGPARP